jgi:hypothetical protein
MEDAMATKRKGSSRKAKKAGDLAVKGKKASSVKGGIIIVGGTVASQLRANPLTTRALNPQPLPPKTFGV